MHHLNIFFTVTTFIGILVSVVAPSNKPRLERRLFWGGFLIASISAIFIAYPPDVKTGALLSLFACSSLLIRAYFSTSYIKIRGKTYAFHVEHRRPDPSQDGATRPGSGNPDCKPVPDAYSGLGLTTAKKMWWLMVFLTTMCSFDVIAHVADKDISWKAALAAAFLVVVALIFGYALDASRGHPIARCQRLQFFIISIITLGVFTVFYLAGYYAGKRWPLGRKQSMGYGAYSRHKKKWP